ncbi:hypothetical protein [Bartonella apihabitans]
MILPDVIVINACLNHHHDGFGKALIALGEGPGLATSAPTRKITLLF